MDISVDAWVTGLSAELLDGLTPLSRLNGCDLVQVEQHPGATTHDASRCWSTDCAGLRSDHRVTGTFSLRQADRQLSGTDPLRRLQCQPAAAGTHQQTGELAFTFSSAGPGAAAVRFSRRRRAFRPAMRRGRQMPGWRWRANLPCGLYWMWRNGRDYEMSWHFGAHVGQPVTAYGVK